MKVLFVDFETQSADIPNTEITEVGAVLMRRDQGEGMPEWHEEFRLSSLVYHPSYPPQTPEIIEITGITDDELKDCGRDPRTVLAELSCIMKEAKYVFAHNKKFDEGVFRAACSRYVLPIPETPWVCTYLEIPWAKKYRCKQLSHLALDHGLKMDGRQLHRAIDDVTLLAELVLTRYDMDTLLKYYHEPWRYVRAHILGPWNGPGGDGGKGKNEASLLGFNWEKPRGLEGPTFPKTWVKRVKESEVEALKHLASFPITVMS